jgi:hypothetical protein
MLASLRSLLPKDWSPAHEVAWSWLWENVERLLEMNMYDPPRYEKHLAKLWASLDANAQFQLRKDIYTSFFTAAPVGQDYFKQSNTRLHFIAEKVCQMTLEMFQDPVKMIDFIAGLGLRHVGYAIPLDLFGPFVTSCIEVLMTCTKDETALEAFRWSLGLISKILVRTIAEGSTIVMKAVNGNSGKMLKKAISCAPRGERASWMLEVQVGTQHISPLSWAIETGSLEAAKAMIDDLLTVRADRERYYYGMEDLFRHHPDFIGRLASDAPSLQPTLLEGLVWRSRVTKDGMRRVNSYVKYFIVDHNGDFSDALKSICASQDPKIMADPVIVLVSDTLWNGLVSSQFLMRKTWFVLSLLCFILSQAVLPNIVFPSEHKQHQNITLFALRMINYCFSMRGLAVRHGKAMFREYRDKKVMWVFHKIPVPEYLKDRFQLASFTMMLLLLLMLSHEPMLWCVEHPDWPVEFCKASTRQMQGRYEVFSMTAMTVHWFLLADMCVFSTGLSAFVLVCRHVLSEVTQFLIGLFFLLMTFASAMSALRHEHLQFRDVTNCVLSLFAITVMRYEGDYREINDEPMLLGGVFLFVLASAVLLLNLLIAQLNCSYEFVYQDMVGFARLNRCACIVDCLAGVSKERWTRFADTLGLNKPLEFNEGDVGMAGGLQSVEPASLHPTVEDSIRRFGGSCSPDMRWPDDDRDHEEDQFEHLEKLIHKVMKRMTTGFRGKGEKGDSGGGSGSKDDSFIKQVSGDSRQSESSTSDQNDNGEI